MTTVAKEILMALIHVLEEVRRWQSRTEGRYFRAKADATAYPTLRSNKEFDTWYEAFIVIARAQGFYKVFDTEYVPMTAEYFEELLRMNDGSMLSSRTQSRQQWEGHMKSHFHDAVCFAILVELIQDAHASVAGSLDHVEVLHWLSSGPVQSKARLCC
ncbi:hypothetical protein SEMRO_476_G150560.1 [Seminavis robusta]|uniref:Uncharacterized protein n=1 Tax=Seminavis robusta TaxID=568900 RepID=A0A9N8DYU3_9STRA|nr:hypothetical protein SEMRO_476_G150560.1 [Seminavis robusta]|eukprot:Sro476_g150560.1 n/a (158) ;mRNA; r:32264-32737